MWTGVATVAPLRRAAVRSASAALAWAAASAAVIGWLLVDGLLAREASTAPCSTRSVSPADGAWRGSPAIGLAVAFVLGMLAAAIARVAGTRAAAPPASRLRSSGRQPVDSVEG